MSVISEANATNVFAIISSDIEPYLQACGAFEQALGIAGLECGLARNEAAALPSGDGIVVVFGSRAATLPLAESLTVVEVMALAARAEGASRLPRHRVHMLPPPDSLMAFVSELQPTVRRLAVPYIMKGAQDYRARLAQRATASGIEILPYELTDPDEVPAALRRMLRAKVDAIWLPPDPLLIRASTFAMMRQFSRSNAVPLYAPTAGFVEAGAVAAITPSYAQMGRTAAAVVQRLLAGHVPESDIYPTLLRRSLNRGAAATVGLSPPPQLWLDIVIDDRH